MKAIFCLLAAVWLLCGCNKPHPKTTARAWEYNLVNCFAPDADLMEAKSNACLRHLRFRLAANSDSFASQLITKAQLEASNDVAQAQCRADMFVAFLGLSADFQSKLRELAAANSTNGWELAGTVPDPILAGNTLLIFKRQK